MASFQEIANKYLKRIINSKEPIFEFKKILEEINNLVYVLSEKPLSNDDKAKIVIIIVEKLEIYFSEYRNATGPKRIFESNELIKSFSNENYLNLIEYITARTNKK